MTEDTDKETNKKEGITLLFLCKCGGNISSQIDFDTIGKWAKERGDIEVVMRANLLCSPVTKEKFSKIVAGSNRFIKKRPIKNIVIAACTPKLHEKTFQDLAETRGVNMSKVQFANIREQCAWVTADKNEATAKAISLIRGALDRADKAEELQKQKMKVLSDVLIIGGGVAGIQTAKILSRAGRKVYIIEKNISIGGSLIKTEEVAPLMECAPCLMAPLLSDVRDDPNIEVIANAEVEEVLGFFGNFSVKVKQKARFVKDNCMNCEECYEVCPVQVDFPFFHGLGQGKAIYSLFAGSVPGTAAIDKDHCIHFKNGSCDECVKVCAFESIDFDQEDQTHTFEAGAIVIATGFKPANLSGSPAGSSLLYDNVYTVDQFERLASTNGPTGGEILLKKGTKPESMAVIHCAGSLTENGLPYCSNLCCIIACKAGEFLREQNKAARVYNIHNDLVFTGPDEYGFYKKQVREGTHFIKTGQLSSVKITKNEDDTLTVSPADAESITVDMVVLANGIVPGEDAGELAGLLNISLNKHGFFLSDHAVLNETGTVLDGIYAAGCALKPVNAAASINLGQAAAGDILSKLIPGREIELEIKTSFIDEQKCSGCKICITVCPYKAISFDSEKNVSRINEALCRGCGTCAAACPGNACSARHFRDEQIYAELGGLLHE